MQYYRHARGNVGKDWAPGAEIFGSDFLCKLRDSVALNLDYWDQRPENLSRDAFERILPLIPDSIEVRWDVRDSDAGPHGHEGEEEVFEFTFSQRALGRNSRYYVKGYFFTPNKLRGVSIQSFHPEKKPPIQLPVKPRGRR